MTSRYRNIAIALAITAALLLPFYGSRFFVFVGTDIVVMALFAVSLNLLIGYTGLVSFGHAAYFGIGAYTCAILSKTYELPFGLAFVVAGLAAGFFAMIFGFFCVRLTRIYFAMLTLAFAQIVWAICFKWNSVTGGEQGLPNVPYPNLDWMGKLPLVGDLRTGDQFYMLAVVLVSICMFLLSRVVRSPFGRMLMNIRENPERAEAIGVHVRRYEHVAFVIAAMGAGFAGALFGIYNRGVFPDFAHWSRSAEVLIMTILGGTTRFFGPAVGAAVLTTLNVQINNYTEYWPLVLGTLLIILLFAFPSGLVGSLVALYTRLRRRRDA
jgi:branched-chain amino acid transport system permease protein